MNNKAYQYHKDGTQPLNGEVFVFGSNKAGFHGAGAAYAAAKYYGAKMGMGFGLCGSSYAIPTKDETIRTMTLDEIKPYVDLFCEAAMANLNVKYFMTRIGCVLAGYSDKEITDLFPIFPKNVNYPEDWKQFIEAREGKEC